MTYQYGLQAARERLAKAQADLRAAQADEARAQRVIAEAERLEREARAIRARIQQAPTKPLAAAENIYGGTRGLLAATREIEQYNARKRHQQAA